MRVHPKGDQIIVRPLLPPGQTTSGIVIPEDARGRPRKGIVLAVGPGAPSELTGVQRPMAVEPFELVFFGEYAGVLIEGLDNNEALLLMREQEVLAGVPEGQYAIVAHQLEATGVVVYHEDHERCEHCPPVKIAEPEPVADLSAMREQLRGDGLLKID